MTKEHKINVSVKMAYIDEQSDPDNKRFVFSYTVNIRNEGEAPARLVSRYWHITDANGQVQEVRGLGVVGEQPYLKPGEDFEYTSGTVIETPVGSMQGSYQMVDDEKSEFDAPIPVFTLATPTALH